MTLYNQVKKYCSVFKLRKKVKMCPRISLGKCNDVNIPKIVQMCKAGKIEAGEAVVRGGKEYFVTPQIAFSHTTNAMGDVRKAYRIK